tara:strand:+ start:21085 stop:22050 length:966 start_codon:yes stop_codon:yes gene_type:complete
MSTDFIVEKILRFSKIKIIKFLIQIFETVIFWFYKNKFKKKKDLNSKFFMYFQLYCNSKISALYRRRKHEILTEKLELNSDIDKKVLEITNKSYVKLLDLDQNEVKKTVDYFYNQKVYTSHVPKDPTYKNKLIDVKEFIETEDENYNYGSFDIGTSLNSTAVRNICSMKKIWDVAEKYLNTDNINIYSINTMLTKKSNKQNYVVNLHVDFDSANMLTFFIYWTDVSKNNGATRIFPGSHLFLHDRRLPGYIDDSSTKYIEDKAGSLYAIDTWALHAGNPNISSPRLVTWIRFSSMPAQTYYLNRNYLFKEKLKEINNAKKY